MKIKYFKAKNFIGIYAGTNLKEIEIREFNDLNKIIMLIGNNGSGKTTLLSLLHPFRETFDNRNEIILEGENGYKEIHLQDYNDLYIIKHYYGKTSSKNKSFISKNNVELNENGGIRTFDQIIKEELKLTKDYFTIGRLGSNVTNFMDLTTAERKKYMNKFIPNIDDYLKAFDCAKNKFSLITKELKSLTTRLDRYSNIDELEESKNFLTNTVNRLQEEIDDRNAKVSEMKGRLNHIELELNIEGKNFEKYFNEIIASEEKLMNDFVTAKKTIELIFSKFPKLESYTEDMLNESHSDVISNIASLQSLLENNKENKERLNEEIQSLKNRKFEYKKRIDAFQNINLDDIKDELNLMKTDLEEFNKIIDIKVVEKWTGKDIKDLYNEKSNIDLFINNLGVIKSKSSLTVIEEFDLNRDYKLELEDITSEIEKLEIRRNKVINEQSIILSNRDLLDILEKRPKNCNIDECPFIMKSLYFKNEKYPKLKEFEEELKEIEIALNDLNQRKNILLDFIVFMKDYDLLSKIYDKIDNKIKKDITLFNLIKYDIGKISDILDIQKDINILNSVRDKENIESKINNMEETLKNAIENKKIINQLNEDVEFIDNRINKIVNVELNNIVEKEEEYTSKLNKNNNKKNIIINVLESTKKLNKVKEEFETIKKIKSDLDTIKSLRNNIDIEEKELESTIKKEILSFKNKLESTTKDITIVTDIMDKLKDIETKYESYKLIKESLDPKIGIPLFFIDNYLKDIEIKANELLKSANNGKFAISFELTESDFFIKVYKSDGTCLKDIRDASQGEVSLTNISLSLSMIEKMIEKYNILYLDEIDATLSTENRRKFLQLLEKQIDKLNIEQIFTISHNQEFDSYPVDLILMKDHNINLNDKEFMEKKNILFKL